MSLQYIETVKFITDGVKNQFLNSIFRPSRIRDFLQFSISPPKHKAEMKRAVMKAASLETFHRQKSSICSLVTSRSQLKAGAIRGPGTPMSDVFRLFWLHHCVSL